MQIETKTRRASEIEMQIEAATAAAVATANT